MITILAIIVLIFMIVISIVDLKYKAIPSIILTGMLFVVCFLNIESIGFGILAFIFAYLIYEGEFISGVADIKVITIVGLMVSSWLWLIVFIVLVLAIGMGYKIYLKVSKKEEDFAFIPIIFIVYLILFFVGGIA